VIQAMRNRRKMMMTKKMMRRTVIFPTRVERIP